MEKIGQIEYIPLSSEDRKRARPFVEKAKNLANKLLGLKVEYSPDNIDDEEDLVVIQSSQFLAGTEFAGAELQVAKPYYPADAEDIWGKRTGSEQFTFYPGLLLRTTQLLKASHQRIDLNDPPELTAEKDAREANYEEAYRLCRILSKI